MLPLLTLLLLQDTQEPPPAGEKPAEAPAEPAPEKPAEEPKGRALVFRLDHVETLAGEAMSNATLVLRDGHIEKMGEAVVIPEHADVHDLRGQGIKGSTAMPPLVLGHANFLNRDTRGSGRNGHFRAVDSLYLDEEDFPGLLAQGVLLLGVDAPGQGIPGRSSVYDTTAKGARPQPLVNDLHLKLTVATDPGALDLLRKAIKDGEDAIAKEKKAREDWEQARKDWEEKQKAKAEADKKAQEQQQQQGGQKEPAAQQGQQQQQQPEEKAPPEKFEPPPIDPDLRPVVEWLRKERVAQVWLNSASDWLHWLNVLGERELPYELVLSHGTSQNFVEVAAAIGEHKLRAEAPAQISFLPSTRIRANLPKELADGGARLVLSPPGNFQFARSGRDRARDMARNWRVGAGDLVREGLDRSTALRAMSVEPAAALGQEERVAPLQQGGPASFVIFDGDPLDATAPVLFVVENGEIRYDRARDLARRTGGIGMEMEP